MRLARSATLVGGAPVAWDVTWEELAAGLTSPPYRTADKGSAPLWCPAELEGWRPLRVWCVVLDLDRERLDDPSAPAVRQEQVVAVAERLRSLGVTAVLHSTHSAAKAGPGRTKARVVIPFSRPVDAPLWRATWTAVREIVAPLADGQCKDAGHRYFAPSAPPDAPPDAVWSVWLPGVPLDPPDVTTGVLEPPPADRRAHREELGLLSRGWRRRTSTAHLGIALAAVVEGVPFAEPGERDATTWRLASAVALALPDASAISLAALFAPSLSLMGPDAPTEADVASKIERARRRRAEEHAPAAVRAATEPRILVTPQGSLYFVREHPANVWAGPFGGDAIDLAIDRALEDAPGVETMRATAQGPQHKTRATLLSEYGERVVNYSIQLGARVHSYDTATATLTEAAAVPRDLAPLTDLDGEIASAYLDALAAGNAKTRRDLDTWLARLPCLDDTLAALVFIGAPGLGKGLFASACSRLWTTDGPADARDVFSSGWNDPILRCPLVFADEKLPAAWKGEDLSAEIRKMLGARVTPIRRRFMPTVNARGCLRLFLAANNDSILSFSGASSEDDIRAIAERFYVVQLDKTYCREFFARFPKAHERLVQGDALARYALALPAPAERYGRFWIEGQRHDAEKIAIRAGAVFALLGWVVSWLQEPRNLSSIVTKPLSTVTEGRDILVSLAEVSQSWQRYFPCESPPERSRLAAGARAIAVQQRNAKGRLWHIKPEYVEAWIRDAGWSAPSVEELITTFLQRSTPMLRGVG